jgi:hypothetical protein
VEISKKAKTYYAWYIFSGEKKRAEERLEEEVRQRSDLAQEVTRLNTTINHKDIEVSMQWIDMSALPNLKLILSVNLIPIKR